jgi:hypothetical protein
MAPNGSFSNDYNDNIQGNEDVVYIDERHNLHYLAKGEVE